jgi:hypothetical protein
VSVRASVALTGAGHAAFMISRADIWLLLQMRVAVPTPAVAFPSPGVVDEDSPTAVSNLSIKSVCWCAKDHRTDQAVRPVVEIHRALHFMG